MMNKQMNLVTRHPSLWEGLGRLKPSIRLTVKKTYNRLTVKKNRITVYPSKKRQTVKK